MKMENEECSNNGGFRGLQTLVLTGSKPLTLEHVINFNRIILPLKSASLPSKKFLKFIMD